MDVELLRQGCGCFRVAKVGVGDVEAQALSRFHPRPLPERDAAVRRRERDLVTVEGDLVGADRLVRDKRQELFGHDHQLLVVAVGLVELQHRELGIVLGRNALIPEVTVDLVDSFDPANGQPLQVELRRNPQIELKVERVVMRDERAGKCSAGDRLHHRRFDLEIPARVQERADRREGSAPDLEDPARIGVHDQIEVALAVAGFDVGEPVPLLGKRDEALREKLEAGRVDRQLIRAGAEEASFDADEVTEIEQFVGLEIVLGEGVLADVDLDLRPAIGDDQKVRLPEGPDRQDAARCAGRGLGRVELGAALRVVRLNKRLDGVGPLKAARIRIDAETPELLKVLPALPKQIGLAVVVRSCGGCTHFRRTGDQKLLTGDQETRSTFLKTKHKSS